MKLLFEYLKRSRGLVALSLSIKIFATLIELAIPYILSHIIDNVVPMKSVRSIVLWGGAMVLCAALALVGNITANRVAARVAKNTTKRLRHSLFQRIMTLSPRQVDKFTIPSLESRVTSDTYNLHHVIGFSLRMGVRAPILLVGGIAVTAVLDPVLTLVMVTVLPLIGAVVVFVSKKGVPLFKQTQRSVDSMIRVVREDAQGIRVIKALSKVDYERRRYDKENRKLVADGTKASTTMAVSSPIVTLLLNLGLVSVILIGAIRVNSSLGEVGKIIAFVQYFTMFSQAMLGLARLFVNFSKGSASAQRVEEVINTEPELQVSDMPRYNPLSPSEGYVTFDNVSFSYRGRAKNLENVSFSLKRGQSLGVIGSTGCGKSTVLRLLMRFYDVDEGGIRIDGRDVRSIPHEELSAMFGVVMQNDFIFAGSIRENIDFGRGLDDQSIRRAARIAQAAEYIEAYEDGYEHHLNSKGVNLSGGQRQRLLIARAIAASPEILLLDDSSSALDYKTDSALRRAINEEMANTTTIVVAQRVSSVMNCDAIIVLDEGRIIGMGKHEELITSCSVYKEISDSQIGGAFVD